MRELFRQFSDRERRTISIVGAALGAAVLLLIFNAFRESGAASGAQAALAEAEQSYKTLSRSHDEKRKEWQSWQDAVAQLAALKKDYFYDSRNVIQDLRLDLQEIFGSVGISQSEVRYGYGEVTKGGTIDKVEVDFRFSGNYATLKGLLDTVERRPRFLHVEKIDFLDVNKQPGLLGLRITCAGYYER
jgi:hypothetical protein